MFKELKTMLLDQAYSIVTLLEFYGFEHINPKSKEIRFSRDEEGGLNISIRLEDNPSLIVHDFARGVATDIFAYIVKEKNVPLGDVLRKVKEILKLENDWTPKKRIQLFEGIYNRITSKTSTDELLPEYSEKILNDYDYKGSVRFHRDGISYEAQHYFHIMFDITSQRIVIPLYDELGRLIGVKGRINETEIPDEVPKYLYLHECAASKYLYGYYQNYQNLFGGTVVVGESEKMVMQAYSFGEKNVVALGSNSLSLKQARLILQLNPQKVIFALDEGLDLEQTERNIKTLRSCFGMSEPEIYYWNYTLDPSLKGTKNSPTDMGKEKYLDIMSNQLQKV